jgi:TolB-like protein
MKTTAKKIRNIVLCLIAVISINANAQSAKKTVGILNIYSSGISLTDEQVGNLVRSEVEKLDTFDVIDRFDMDYMIKQKSLNASCNSKLCLIEIGKIINADYMFSGSAELIGENIVITLRLIDVQTGAIEKTQVDEFLNLPTEIKSMLNITVSEMFGKAYDKEVKTKLAQKYSYDNTINNPQVDKLNCSGPRMGVTFVTGTAADVLKAPKSKGGYDGYPVMFQFGYQWEQQYLNEGNFQALFEFIPLITGLEQGMFIPSFTMMNGIRNNRNGWEFAFGPTFTIGKSANGYYDENGQWHLQSELLDDPYATNHEIVSRMDSRGHLKLSSGFVFAFGKTIKSGNLNMPVNIFVNPNKDGFRFGVSFGYNAKRK